jgi:tRNA A-37 threonylcarbamoyl transferase component Bud32
MRTVGPYRLRELIGRGASSEVYAAEHASYKDVAVKLLRPELAEDDVQIHALLEEGARLRAIDHPNVVRVLDAGLDADGCYLVMERVRGEPLAARLRREGRLPEAEVRRLGAELADGVAAAHTRGIIHRDLKPANVMLDGARPKIVDFGISKYLGARSAVTTGRMIGTLAYMAPEQLTSGMIAPCTDIYALGVILFEALAGRHPFDNFADGRCPQLFDEPARVRAIVPAVSPELDDILARCLAREPARRPASADELARLLRGELVLDDRITADAGPLVPVALPPRSRRRVAVGDPALDDRITADAGVVLMAAARRPRSRWRVAAWLVGGTVVIAGAVSLAVVAQRDAAPVPIAPRVVQRAEPVKREIEIAPTPVDRPPVVEVRSKPGGAQVIVDGTLRGVTPLTFELALPEVVVIQRAGYRRVERRLERAGVVDVTLRPLRRPTRPTKPATIKEPLD